MTVVFTDEQIIAEVPGLDRTMLMRFVQARIVIPVDRPAEKAKGFLPVDVARLRLACELCESFEFEDDALGVVMGLVDRLHATRSKLQAVLEAVEDLPEEQKLKVAEAVKSRWSQGTD
ncbi:hypothetical protein [Aliiruegeria lutimaris]|uniref:Chaperone modulatory protein CbpM n=1 Tax=Aliiruegeria lutimaris TaxID=571298 RepID=A0A1G8YFJ2_9RHOB|nr:hypothetical protein [Aliiruegeria lutimaris]SDK01481.1 chaperone modulatory protein CbpM [Aliiruegeria lutimaris]